MTAFNENRYDSMVYNRCGRWGVKFPAISLGAWQTYGGYISDEVSNESLAFGNSKHPSNLQRSSLMLVHAALGVSKYITLWLFTTKLLYANRQTIS